MADQEKDKQMQMDDMLDSLLANYSSVEPRPGLESRILANLREAEKTPQRWWNFKWIWAGAALAALIVGGVVFSGKRHISRPTHRVAQTVQPAVQQPVVQQPTIQHPIVQSSVPTVGATPAIHHRHKALAPTRPQNATLAWNQRPTVFPTPTPLSEQEELLLRYYAGTPREEMIAQSHPDDPPVMGDQEQTEAIPDLMHIPQKLSNTR